MPTPKIGYHLLAEKWAIQALHKRRLKVARLSEVNDPFELAALNCMKADRRAALKKFKERENKRIGMLCFSEQWKDPVMWGHYADNHRGVCLGFELDPALGVNGLQKVSYVEAKLDLKSDLGRASLPADIRDRLLVTKFANWAYEREHRAFLELRSLDEDSGHYFQSFGSHLRLREVILGPHCPGTSLGPIRDLAKTIDP